VLKYHRSFAPYGRGNPMFGAIGQYDDSMRAPVEPEIRGVIARSAVVPNDAMCSSRIQRTIASC
jgi:hypothetical protein